MTWEKGSLKILIKRVYIVCSNENLLREELHQIEKSITEFRKIYH